MWSIRRAIANRFKVGTSENLAPTTHQSSLHTARGEAQVFRDGPGEDARRASPYLAEVSGS